VIKSPFVIHEESQRGVFRVYVFGRVGLFPSGNREDAERMVASLEYERVQWNKVPNAELDDLRALLARAVEIFGAEVNTPESPESSPTYEVSLVDVDGGPGQELRVARSGETIRSETDLGEPEDNMFYRDWKWVPDALREAYAFGLADGAAALGKAGGT
jgi:hypothetical protein